MLASWLSVASLLQADKNPEYRCLIWMARHASSSFLPFQGFFATEATVKYFDESLIEPKVPLYPGFMSHTKANDIVMEF